MPLAENRRCYHRLFGLEIHTADFGFVEDTAGGFHGETAGIFQKGDFAGLHGTAEFDLRAPFTVTAAFHVLIVRDQRHLVAVIANAFA